MPKALPALLLAACFLLAATTRARAQVLDQEAIHVLSLRVMASNHEVMAPVVQVAAGTPASVAIISDEGPSYTLVITVQPPTPNHAPNTSGIDVSLWNGGENIEVRMIEGRLSANGTRVISDEQGSAVELISHAVYRTAPRAPFTPVR